MPDLSRQALRSVGTGWITVLAHFLNILSAWTLEAVFGKTTSDGFKGVGE